MVAAVAEEHSAEDPNDHAAALQKIAHPFAVAADLLARQDSCTRRPASYVGLHITTRHPAGVAELDVGAAREVDDHRGHTTEEDIGYWEWALENAAVAVSWQCCQFGSDWGTRP